MSAASAADTHTAFTMTGNRRSLWAEYAINICRVTGQPLQALRSMTWIPACLRYNRKEPVTPVAAPEGATLGELLVMGERVAFRIEER